jgi:hypothetical protein
MVPSNLWTPFAATYRKALAVRALAKPVAPNADELRAAFASPALYELQPSPDNY